MFQHGGDGKGDAMALKYPGDWKFSGVGFEVPPAAVAEFAGLLKMIADGSKDRIESFKAAFGRNHRSSSLDYAVFDLKEAMEARASNAATFVDALWTCIEHAAGQGLVTPSYQHLNTRLAKHGIALELQPPRLRLVGGAEVVIDASDPDVIGTLGFSLGDRIGAGGYGTVYRATRSTSVSAFDYAIKILDPSPFTKDPEKALQRFVREIRALRSLQHRAIVSLIEAGLTHEKKPYLVMPLIDGKDLVTACRGAALDVVIDTFLEILRGLEYAHGLGVIHRDLKPTNIIVRRSDHQPIILDFGAAYTLDDLDEQSLTTQAVGTLGYLPSEVIADPKSRSPLNDVYACGIMLYEVLAGRRPDPAHYVGLGTIRSDWRDLDKAVIGAIAGSAARTPSAHAMAEQLMEWSSVNSVVDRSRR